MSTRNDIEVVIGGKVIKLVGYESEEYLQKIAAYINGKLAEYEKVDSFKRQPIEMQNVLIQLNIADDYFKAKKQLDELTEEMELKDKELYDIKHELIATQIKMESKDKMIRDYQKELTKV
ncbi:MAG: cell division protein ZapA [Lachnospiraceae bacterium]|nr:cell division protein ZapA [Lachnospiraceae bacterium]